MVRATLGPWARDEQAELTDGEGAVLSSRSWLEALAGAAAVGDMPAMQVMMGVIPGGVLLGIPGAPGGGHWLARSVAALRPLGGRVCTRATWVFTVAAATIISEAISAWDSPRR